MKIFDSKTKNYVDAPKEVTQFITELENICRKYNLSLSHEDTQGSFLIEQYSQSNIEWLKDAYKNY